MTTVALLSVASALVSFGAADIIRRHAFRLGFTDLPNARSLHTTITPRGGGAGFALAVPAAIACSMVLRAAPDRPQAILLIAAVAVAAVGLADDRWGLPAGVRLLAQVVAALCVAGSGAVVREVALPSNATWDLGVLAVPATMVWLVGLTNIYNFMDGIDGLAASQAIVTAGAMCLLAICLGREDAAAAMAILGAGVIGFVVLNWAPARIFMGDVGSTFLGFLLAGFAVLPASADRETLPVAAWVAVLSPFLFDALWTLARRIVRREPIHKAHRSHIYQMLVRAGWSHARTTLLYAALASSAGIVTVLHYGVHLIPPQIYVAAVLAPLAVPPLLVAAVRRHP